MRSAVALRRSGSTWSAYDVDLDDVETLDDLIDQLDDADEPEDLTVVYVEEDDEWLGVLRMTVETVHNPRIFLSDSRVLATSTLAERVFADALPVIAEADDLDDDEETAGRLDAQPVGDLDLLADLGTPGDVLIELIAEEGALPSDVIATLCERAGCLDVLDELRGG